LPPGSDSEDGGSAFLHSVGELLQDYTQHYIPEDNTVIKTQLQNRTVFKNYRATKQNVKVIKFRDIQERPKKKSRITAAKMKVLEVYHERYMRQAELRHFG
jgi:hypothetical protein